jgi:hypothetical protein
MRSMLLERDRIADVNVLGNFRFESLFCGPLPNLDAADSTLHVDHAP